MRKRWQSFCFVVPVMENGQQKIDPFSKKPITTRKWVSVFANSSDARGKAYRQALAQYGG